MPRLDEGEEDDYKSRHQINMDIYSFGDAVGINLASRVWSSEATPRNLGQGSQESIKVGRSLFGLVTPENDQESEHDSESNSDSEDVFGVETQRPMIAKTIEDKKDDSKEKMVDYKLGFYLMKMTDSMTREITS